ncbi:MAG: hypothetical protein IKV62_02390 [Bacteroidales bacterium]|nr:hypothetical protein [Bacteroidales bacterium]
MLLLESNVFMLFISGGYVTMTIISLLLIGIFFAAWKAPNWVKEIGLIAFAFGFMSTLIGFVQAADFLQAEADISPNVVWGGVKVGLIPVIYGSIVYIISLVIRLIKKPRI